MRTASLPTEIQLLILTNVFYKTPASSARLAHTTYPELPVNNYPLAATFLAARTTAPEAPSVTVAAIPGTSPQRVPPLNEINDAVILRAALAAAIPAWRGALCGIPGLWTQIAVPVDKGTWGPAVLDALNEALACSRGEPLSVLITHAPTQAGEGAIGDDESERARVAQVMSLLQPHIVRWRYFRLCTLYPAAVPVPTVDFSGEAPLLNELHLCAALPTPPAGPIASGGARALDVPQLYSLTMDAHAFYAAYLRAPNTLPAVYTLTLTGPGAKGVDGPPVMSVRALLACAAQMRSLGTLWIEGIHLSVGINGEREREWGHEDLALKQMARLHCEHLPVDVLDEILTFSIDIDEGDDVVLELEIVACPLPREPPLAACRSIELNRIPMDEDLVAFLMFAEGCTELTLMHCPASFVKGLSCPVERETWLLPRLEEISVYNCEGVDVSLMHELLRMRHHASNAGDDCISLVEATLDDESIDLFSEENSEQDHSDEDDSYLDSPKD